ncbi:DNA pilot protein [Peromfec virus RodF7_7]|uniref:DNA pilot protein n=1 Tax=Peromfec virus RodF7_7 TaxID=2929355 RepID=A0A976N2R8_9VIRU|nr:DNA pilot protein [Peromfec virus RodF7_7]
MGLLDAIGGLITGGLNFGAQMKANKTNMQINQDNIAAAYNMQDRANAEARAMFAMENAEYDRRTAASNEYNSPVQQVQRLKDAGLNPYMMLNGGSAGQMETGTVGSMSAAQGSVPGSLPATAPQMSAPQGLDGLVDSIKTGADVIGQIKTMKSNIRKQNAEASIIESDANVRDIKNRIEIAKLHEEYENMKKDGKLKDIDIDFGQQTMDARVAAVGKQNDLLDKQANLYDLNAKTVEAGLPYVSQQAYANVINTWANTKLTNMQQQHEYKKMFNTMQDTILKRFQADGIKISNEQARKLTPILYYNAQQQGWNLYQDTLGKMHDNWLKGFTNQNLEDLPAWLRPNSGFDRFMQTTVHGTAEVVGTASDAVYIKNNLKANKPQRIKGFSR